MNNWKQDTGSLDLEEILKEFGAEEPETPAAEEKAVSLPAEESFAVEFNAEESFAVEFAAEQPAAEAPAVAEDTEEAPAETGKEDVTGDTLRLDDLRQIVIPAEPEEEIVRDADTVRLDTRAIAEAAEAIKAEAEKVVEEAAATETEESTPEEKEEEIAPPKPLVFDPKQKLRELKRKLVAGPERRYYELAEKGLGGVQMSMFLCLIVVAVSAGAALMYSLDMVPENRQKLMVFGQIFAMLLGALLGSHQMIDGVVSLLKGKFTANTLLPITFLACCADGVFCLQEQRVPLCAAFTLEVLMSLWGEYHSRVTEMGMMDTMRKAVRLDSVVRCNDYFEGQSAILRGEGQVEDFMDNYSKTSGPQKVQNIYALIALLLSMIVAVAAGLLHGISLGVQIFSTTLLVSMPASFFIALSRPMAVLERRLHEVGTVLCGWKGVTGLAAKCLYPLNDHDMFPAGSVKMNGVKFYGDRDPETVIAYAAALMHANGGGLAPIFDHLLATRNGIRYQAKNLHFYGNGGIGGEINDDPVLMGTLEFLKEMGVEIPDGTMVKQAVYVSVDGDLCGLFAITYNKVHHAETGMSTLCSSRRIRPVIIAKDFLLTGSFLKETFGLRPKRTAFPSRSDCIALEGKRAPAGAEALALTTKDGLSSVAYAITGARALFTACRMGLVVHIMGGALGLVIMAALAFLGSAHLLTPIHILLYQLVWIIPGFVVTMWTRAI